MKIKIFNEEKEFSFKKGFIIIGKVLLVMCFIRLWGYYVDYVNDEGIAKMRAVIPAVTSIDGTKKLNEEMEVTSRTKGLYFGICGIDEKGGEKEIVRHYKNEFQKYGWKYIGRYYLKDVHPDSNKDERYYYFEKYDNYCMYLCLQMNEFVGVGKCRIVFHIGLKRDYDGRKHCKIEND